MNVILLGAPGSGKGTQAEHIEAAFGLTHVSSGDLFRYNLKNQTELGKLAEGYMKRGELVPDDVTVAMVRDRLQQPDITEGVLLDGFPRTLPQADALANMLHELGQRVDAVVYLDVADDEIVTRLSGRLICRECQAPFHKTFNPFDACPENKCHGEHLYQRDDDKPETVGARLQTYHAQTSPLVEHYREKGILLHIPGTGSIEEISERILTAIRAQTAV